MVYKPLSFALWLAFAGISIGISLGWGWLVVLGFVAPLVVLVLAVVLPLLK